MSFKISMFSGSTDLDEALTLLAQTAMGLPRDCNTLTLEQAHEHYCSEAGYNQLLQTAKRFQINPLPKLQQLDRLFRDELLSRKALRTHAARNVYNSGKLALWQALWTPFKDKLLPNQVLIQAMADFIALNTVQSGVNWLVQQLESMGFAIKHLTSLYREPSGLNQISLLKRLQNYVTNPQLIEHVELAKIKPAFQSKENKYD